MIKKISKITGLVQGVGFRVAFERSARSYGLSGWVRNRCDGSVEALVSGDSDAIKKIIDWARQGPEGAVVKQILIEDADLTTLRPGQFLRLPTE
ncbi:acylphosphatase [Undibacterium arcticum]